MPDEPRAIFRREALSHLIHGQEKSVLPRLIRPRTFLCLWLLLGLLILAGGLAWAAQVPIYAFGTAVVVESQGEINLAVLVPAESIDKLAVGQTVWVHWTSDGEPAKTQLTSVEPKVQSPADVRKRFGLSSETVNRAVVVAMADAESVIPVTSDLSRESHVGSTVPVAVEIGSRRALSLLPFIGEAFR